MQEVAEAIDAAMDADDEDKAEALQEEGERLGEQLQALEDGLLDYAASVKAAAGAIVTIDRNGEAVIHRGLLREAEAKALRTLEKLRQGFSGAEIEGDDDGEDADEAPKAAAMSDRLAQRLSAHRAASATCGCRAVTTATICRWGFASRCRTGWKAWPRTGRNREAN